MTASCVCHYQHPTVTTHVRLTVRCSIPTFDIGVFGAKQWDLTTRWIIIMSDY